MKCNWLFNIQTTFKQYVTCQCYIKSIFKNLIKFIDSLILLLLEYHVKNLQMINYKMKSSQYVFKKIDDLMF